MAALVQFFTLFITVLPFLAGGLAILGVFPLVVSEASCFSTKILLVLVCEMVLERPDWACRDEEVLDRVALDVVQLANVMNWLYFFMLDFILAGLPFIFMNRRMK